MKYNISNLYLPTCDNMSEQKSSAHGIAWNFEGLYTSLDDPKLKADLEACVKGAEEFESKYRSLIGPDLTAQTLRHP